MDARAVATVEFAAVGVYAQLLVDADLRYLLVSSRVEPAQSMLLQAGPGVSPRGLTAFSRMGRWHALYWSLVWGWGRPPESGVLFTSGDLRFRREAQVPACGLDGGWLALCEGVFTVASFADAWGCDTWLALAPQW